ncbi:hypothetical protein [Metabacillus litoralis]|uniref:hypothetical protein n=1 Tax=Metabacillus litoralis TaxID=152268 RepID=UPI001CFDA473|nr:hypothetical protein [Metabacillus litoralis]
MSYLDIFFNSNGDFDLRSTAAAIGLLGVILTATVSIIINMKTLKQQKQYNLDSLEQQKALSKENFKGNVVATSRIEWIQEVRKLSVEFISSCYSLLKYVEILKATGFFEEVDHEKRKNKISRDSKLSELRKDLQERGTLLALYFGPDSSGNNEFVNYIVSLIILKVDKLGTWYPVDEILNLDDFINVLKDFLRIYFKAEWKRANGEIEDSNLQKYLDANHEYLRIMTIFSEGIDMHLERTEAFYSYLAQKYK